MLSLMSLYRRNDRFQSDTKQFYFGEFSNVNHIVRYCRPIPWISGLNDQNLLELVTSAVKPQLSDLK